MKTATGIENKKEVSSNQIKRKSRKSLIASPKQILEQIFMDAGIEINGSMPWDIQIHNENAYSRILAQGTLGAGESYMDGWWDVEQLDEFFTRLISIDIEKILKRNPAIILSALKGMIFNLQRRYTHQVAEKHYDIGNDLYEKMLDSRLTYSCGYWKRATNNEEAQKDKLDLVCRKLNLRPGDTVLDIGSGWGSFINYAAENYGVKCLGITVSKEQTNYANAHRKNLPVETKQMDYMELDGKFDHIVSIGMFEHVGKKNYRKFMEKVNSLLKQDGLFLLHSLVASRRSNSSGDPWVLKYIFPNSVLPSPVRIMEAADRLFIPEDIHNFGVDYERTLLEWEKNFVNNWDSLKDAYDERFFRMWRYYLLSFVATFRARTNHLWQIVFSKKGVPGGYQYVR